MKRTGKPGAARIKWGVKRRLEFIEFRLFWEGSINRADIIDFFHVSVPQASKDLNQYQSFASGNLKYDKSKKRYVAEKKFTPRFIDLDSDRYLAQLLLPQESEALRHNTWLATQPDVSWMPIPIRRIDPIVLRALVTAIRQRCAADILYQSMNPDRPDPIWRGITPHAFGNDGLRWHVRAYCHIGHKFKDFLLSRCLECREGGEALEKARADRQWHETIEVKLKPNPRLSESQQRIIASDYGMENSQLSLYIKKSLIYYFNKRLRLDVADTLDDPRETPVVLVDPVSFQEALEEVMM